MSTDRGTLPRLNEVLESVRALPSREVQAIVSSMATDEYRMLGCKAVLPLMKRLAYQDAVGIQATGRAFLEELISSPGFIVAQCLGGTAFVQYAFHFMHRRFADDVRGSAENLEQFREFMLGFDEIIEETHGSPLNFDEFLLDPVSDAKANPRQVVMQRMVCEPQDWEYLMS